MMLTCGDHKVKLTQRAAAQCKAVQSFLSLTDDGTFELDMTQYVDKYGLDCLAATLENIANELRSPQKSPTLEMIDNDVLVCILSACDYLEATNVYNVALEELTLRTKGATVKQVVDSILPDPSRLPGR